MTELGYVVTSGRIDKWKAAGVKEVDGVMRVWGPMFSGTRLDLLLENINPDVTDYTQAQFAALKAVVSWIKAKLQLGETVSVLNPGAAFIQDNNVFFAPDQLSNRCLYIEGIKTDSYNCPDLSGISSITFCAGVMLYRILAGFHPFTSSEIYQDMREGIFLPVNLAVPALNEKLSALIQTAMLLPVEKKYVQKPDTGILTEILEILTTINDDVSSLFVPLSAEKKSQIEKEKKLYLIKRNSVTGTKRFVTRNKYFVYGITAAVLIGLFIIVSIIQSRAQRPTTAGMTPDTVITSYFEAFSILDHQFMEACIMGASKSDINVAASYFAVSRARQAYEYTTEPILKTAQEWIEQGGELPSPDVFGVTDLTIEHLSGSVYDGEIVFRAEYILWSPNEHSLTRTDIITLKLDRRNNWRITNISRTESY